MTIEIPLTKGYTALIDDADFHLSGMRWYTAIGPTGIVYARRNARRINGSRFTAFLHRAVLGLDPKNVSIVDHINGNGLDCRRANLRLVTRQENARNVVGSNKRASTSFLGVSRHNSGWQAHIRINGKQIYIGLFSSPEKANHARLVFEKTVWGIQPRRKAAFEAAGLS